MIVLFKKKERTFFVYGFAKSDRGNINLGELHAFKERAKDVFLLTDKQIGDRVKKGTLIEILSEAGYEIQK